MEVLHSIPTFTVATAGFRFTIHASTWLIGWEIVSISGTTLGSWDSEIASNNVSPLWTNQDFMRCDFWSCVFFSWLIVFFLDLMCFLGQMMTDTLHHPPLDDSWTFFFGEKSYMANSSRWDDPLYHGNLRDFGFPEKCLISWPFLAGHLGGTLRFPWLISSEVRNLCHN